jgi:hypothetical protein
LEITWYSILKVGIMATLTKRRRIKKGERGDQTPRHREYKMQRHFVVLLLLAASFTPLLLGGPIKEWSISEVERAPVLIVGRVGSVRRDFQVSPNSLSWKAETWAMTTDVEIIRSYSSSGRAPKPGSSIAVRFFAYGPSQTLFGNGPPPLVSLKPGEVLLIPLQANEPPTKDRWMLLGIEGIGLTAHVREQLGEALPQANTERQFILREIANSLSHGTPGETSFAGGYVHDQYQNLTSDLMPLLRIGIGADERRWATVLVDLMGPRRPGLNDLRAGGWRDLNWNPSADHGFSIALVILRQLPGTPRSDHLIIDALIARMGFAPE